MAATENDRDVCYFTFGDEKLAEDLYNIYEFVKARGITVGQLYNVIINYQVDVLSKNKKKLAFYEYVTTSLSFDQSTDEEMEVESKKTSVKQTKVTEFFNTK